VPNSLRVGNWVYIVLLGGGPKSKMGLMTKATETVLAEALRLDVKARAELATELLASLDGPADPDATTAWATEIEDRLRILDSGAEPLESWDDAKQRISREILGR